MPQAQLPDLNTQWIINTREFWTAIKQKNYPSMFGALQDVNAMLPKDYQVEVNTIKYNKMIQQDLIFVCYHCALNCPHCLEGKGECIAETNRHKIVIKKILNSTLIKLLIKRNYTEKWQCPRCNNYNVLSKTKKIQNVLEEPYFLKVVPEPPNRKDGIIDRREFDTKIEKWALLFMNELQYQMGKYRQEYVPKTTDVIEEPIMDGQESLDTF